MSLSDIRVEAPAEDGESLTAALQALLAWSGYEVAYANVNAALGLAFTISVRDPSRCLATWMSEGRDMFLAETASRLGIRLRELHPPEAAAGLDDTPEFAQHFEASYRPLIQRALEHGQPALVWRGWPGQAAAQWGIITTSCSAGLGFSGTTLGFEERPAALVAPAVQVYVVEEITPRAWSEAEFLGRAVRHAQIIVNNQTDPRFGLTTGPAVYDAWLQRLRQDPVCETCPDGGRRCHPRLVRAVVHARQSAVRFLSEHHHAAPARARQTVQALIGECESVIQALTRSCDVETLQDLLDSRAGRDVLAGDIRLAQSHELNIRQYIEVLSGALET